MRAGCTVEQYDNGYDTVMGKREPGLEMVFLITHLRLWLSLFHTELLRVFLLP